MRKAWFVALSSVFVLLLAVGPAMADTPLSHSGKVGPHRLVDNWNKPGMNCRFAQVEPKWWMLDRISVRPPKMRGTRDNQRVAWRFFVERTPIGTGTAIPADWKVTYRSPRQFGTAHVHTPASFSRMGVPVEVPAAHAHGDTYAYRVKVRMLWYRANGALQGKATHIVDFTWQSPPDDVFTAPCFTSQPPSA
jgi:hypothetical protein